MESNLTLIYLLVGGLVGISTFAFTNAFTVWANRNSASPLDKGGKSISLVLARFFLVTILLISLFFMFRAWLPYTKAEHVGLLQGEDLFSVRAVKGFAAEFPTTNKNIVKDDILVSFHRKPDPKERADAMLQRDILLEKISFEELKTPIIDAPTIALLQSLQRRMNELNEKERQLMQQQEMSKRSGERYENDNATAEQRIRRDLESLSHRINQQNAAVNLTQQELDFAERIASEGLVSKLELSRKREANRVAISKLEELKSQQRFLESSASKFESSGSTEEKEENSYSKITDGWLQDIQRERATILEQLAPVEKAVAGEEVAAAKRLDSQVNQLKVELQEVERTIAGYEDQPSIEVRAPWDGIVGYRDTSPNNIKRAGTPLAVIYRPDSVYVSVQVTTNELNQLESTENIFVTNSMLEKRDIEVRGRISSVKALSNDLHEVAITIEPPGYILKDLVDNGAIDMRARFVNRPLDFSGLISAFSFSDGGSTGQSPAVIASIYLFLGMLILFGIQKLSAVINRPPAPDDNTPNEYNNSNDEIYYEGFGADDITSNNIASNASDNDSNYGGDDTLPRRVAKRKHP